VAFHPRDEVVLTGSDNGTAQRWDLATKKPLGAPLSHPGKVLAVAFAPGTDKDGPAQLADLVTGCSNGRAYLWRRTPGDEFEQVGEFRHDPLETVRAVAFHPSGRVLTGTDGRVCLWDVTGNPNLLDSWKQHHPVNAVAWGAEGNAFAAACGSARTFTGEARLWRRLGDGTWPKEGELLAHQAAVNAVAFSPDGKFLATGSQDRSGRLWEVATGKQFGQPLRHPRDVRLVAFGADSQTVWTDSDDQVFRVWQLAEAAAPARWFSYRGAPGIALFSPDRGTVLAGGLACDFRRLLPGAIEPPATLQHTGPVYAAAVSTEPVLWLTGGETLQTEQGWARLWDASGQLLAELPHRDGVVWSVALHPRGELLATGCADGLVRVWAVKGGQVGRKPWTGPHGDRVYAVAFSADGRYLLTGSRDRFARIWDTTTWKLVHKWEHPDAVLSATFAADGRHILTGYAGGAQLWRWDDASQRLDKEGPPFPHQAGILSVALADDGRSVLTGGTDGTVSWWDVATSKPRGPTWRHTGLVRAAAFGPRGTVLTASTSIREKKGSASLWRLPEPVEGSPEQLMAWGEAVTGIRLQDNALIILDVESWENVLERLQSKLRGFPRIEDQLQEEHQHVAEMRQALAQGRKVLAAGDLDGAGRAFTAAARIAPDDPEVVRARQDLHKAREAAKADADAERKHADAAPIVPPENEEKKRIAEVRKLLAEGQAALAAQDLDGADKAIAAAGRLAPGDPEVAKAWHDLEKARKVGRRTGEETRPAPERMPLLPDDTEILATINVKQILDSALVKKVGLDKVKDALKNQDKAQQVLDALGFDPFKDLDSITVAGPGSKDSDKGLVILKGTFDVAKFRTVADAAARDHPDIFKTVKVPDGLGGNYEMYEVSPPGVPTSFFVSIASKDYILIAPAKDYLIDAHDKLAGRKKTNLKSKEMAALIGRLDPKQSMTVAVVARGLEQSPLAEQETSRQIIEKLDDVIFGVTIDKDVSMTLSVTAKDAKSAEALDDEIRNGLNAALGFAAWFASQRKELTPLVDTLKSIKPETRGKIVSVKVKFEGDEVEKLFPK
jgi:WD40 repeat protein